MRKYETFFIMNPDLPDEMTSAADEKLKGIVTAQGGMVISYEPWGKKRLAYPVKKHTRGLYILMEYAGGPALVAELERNMRLDERVLKFITVKLDDRYDPDKEESRTTTRRSFGDEEEGGAAAATSEAEPEGEEEAEDEIGGEVEEEAESR